MSETDDTDELLLIPPDFFYSNSNLQLNSDFVPCYDIVDNLITQVRGLEQRINTIEIISEPNIIEMSEMQKFRKFASSEEIPFNSNSCQSTPQKPRTKFTMNSLPSTPSVASKMSPRKKPTDLMIGEIDNFISNVKLIKRINAARSLESDFVGDYSEKETLKLDRVDEILKNMELNHMNIEDRIRETEREVYREVEKPFTKEKLWQAGDNIGSVPNYGTGMRECMYPNENFDSNSSESTQATVFERSNAATTNNLNCGKGSTDSDLNLELVSLSRLWNTKSDTDDLPSKFKQKLHEEKLRRQHCEDTIKVLQNRNLELQERLAVAVQVDEAKDKALLRFHDCWEKAGLKLDEAKMTKEKLEDEYLQLKKKSAKDLEEIAQKISHYEVELSRVLSIAHASETKLSMSEKNNADLRKEVNTVQNDYLECQKRYSTENEKNRQLLEIMAQKEIELNEARKEVAESKQAVEMCHLELSSLQAEHRTLQDNLMKQKQVTTRLMEENKSLLDEVGAHKSNEKGLEGELSKTREQLENNKLQLKNFYQGQVELVVQNKLKEFQQQLDSAEKSLKEELAKKELSIAKMAASHIQQISEKHSLEIKLLEEKHQEECRLFQLQLSQLHQEAEEANSRLKRQQDKHMTIERQLQKFMESLRKDHVTTVEDINSFRSRSYSNLEEILSWKLPEDERKKGDESDRNSQLTYKVLDTPVTSRNEKGAKRRENSLKETMQMLLDKKPTHEEKNSDEVVKDGFFSFYQRLKEGKTKPAWK